MPRTTDYEIKTTLAIDGEKAFKAAMEDAQRAMRVHNADLKAMAAEYEYTDDKQRYFAQRAETVNEKLKQQEAIVDALNRAVKEAGDKYGEAASQTDGYRIKLSNATAKMFDMRREAEQANRELEDLGKDSNRIGRQIERGIGDAAENTADKLDNMFAKVAQDVNALKSNVAFETSMDVGSFVLDGIQNVMGFVQENQEFNRRMAQTKTVVEMYGYNADEIINIAKYAGSIIGDFENAQEALVNLAAAGFEDEEQIKATVESLLGVWLSSGGTLDFSGLAEDYLESVKEKTPTGTFAEAIIKFTDRSVEDVQKVLESVKTHADTLEAATAVLTEARLQTKTKNYVEGQEELIKAENANIELQIAWAGLAERIQPTVTGLIEGTTDLVEGLNTTMDEIEKFKNFTRKQIETKTTGEELIQSSGITTEELKPDFIDKMVEWRLKLNEYLMIPVKKIEDWIIPSANAEEMPAEELQNYGFDAANEIATGMMHGMEKNEAVYTAVQTAISEMNRQDVIDEASASGKSLMTAFGNGIAEAAAIPIGNVREMVNTINAMLANISAPAFGLGWDGISGGNIYQYTARKNFASTMSKTIGAGVQPALLKK